MYARMQFDKKMTDLKISTCSKSTDKPNKTLKEFKKEKKK